MLDTHALSALADILAAGQPAAHVRFLEEIGDLRPRFSDLRCPCTIKTLLYRRADLRPSVRASLDAELRQRWPEFNSIVQKGADSAPLTPAPIPPEPILPRENAKRREDRFDRFLGWVACLLGR